MDAAIKFGVYVPASVTGSLTVSVVARPAPGCNGYSGAAPPRWPRGDQREVTDDAAAEDVCHDTGAAGTGGSAGVGAGGSRRHGGRGRRHGGRGRRDRRAPAVRRRPAAGRRSARRRHRSTPPSLANCACDDHDPPGLTCATRPRATDDNPYIYDVAVSPDGQLLATAARRLRRRRGQDLERSTATRRCGCGPLVAWTATGTPTSPFSPDGQYFADRVATRCTSTSTACRSFTLVAAIHERRPAERSTASAFVARQPDACSASTDSTRLRRHAHADRVAAARSTGVPTERRSLLSRRCRRCSVGGGDADRGRRLRTATPPSTPWTGATYRRADAARRRRPADALGSCGFSPNGAAARARRRTMRSRRFWASPFTSTTLPPAPTSSSATCIDGRRHARSRRAARYLAIAGGYLASVSIWNVATRATESRYNLLRRVSASPRGFAGDVLGRAGRARRR